MASLEWMMTTMVSIVSLAEPACADHIACSWAGALQASIC